jgi:hypothetical protein
VGSVSSNQASRGGNYLAIKKQASQETLELPLWDTAAKRGDYEYFLGQSDSAESAKEAAEFICTYKTEGLFRHV